MTHEPVTHPHGAPRRDRAVEWPTWGLIATIYGAWLALAWHYNSAPAWLTHPLWVVVCAWYMSLQHELVHGHPTRHLAFNRWLGLAPLTVWYPYDVYRDSHLAHHRDELLTLPGTDPESNYLHAEAFAKLPAPLRAIYWASRTFLGRFALGPALAIGGLLRDVIFSGATWRNPASRFTWLQHLALLALLLWALHAWAGVSPWVFLFGVAYPALGLAMLRSFYEHRPAATPSERIVINEAAWPWRMLYLNNNYHSVHHDHPGLPWYQIPAAFRADRDGYLTRNGGFHLQGYAPLLFRHGLKPIDSPVFPARGPSAGA